MTTTVCLGTAFAISIALAGCHGSEEREARSACTRVATLCGGQVDPDDVDACIRDVQRMRSTVGEEATRSTLRCIDRSTSCADATGCATGGALGGAAIEFTRGFARALAPMLPSPPRIGLPNVPPAPRAPSQPMAPMAPTVPLPGPAMPSLPAMPQMPTSPATVVLRVTGNAHDVDVHYTLGASSSDVHVTQLPWEQTISNPGGMPMQTLTATTSEQGVALSCEIIADGASRAQATSTGGMMQPAVCVAMPAMPGFVQ